MKITHLIAQHIIEVHEGNNWTEADIKNTVEDVTYKEAQIITSASKNTIAALLHHITFWNTIILQRLTGDDPFINDLNGFDVPVLKNKEEWLQLQQDCFQSAHVLAAEVKQFPEERLPDFVNNKTVTFYKTLQGIIEHNYYHLGQIIILKNLIKNNAAQYNVAK